MKRWEKTLLRWGLLMYAEEQNVAKLMLNFGVSWVGRNFKDVSKCNRVTGKERTVKDG